MEETMPIKEIAKIGNNVIMFLAGLSENHKHELDTEERDYSKCPITCQFTQFAVKDKAHICENHCPFSVTKKKRVVYTNEKHQYNISKAVAETKFSKTAIKFYILCHFLHIDSLGFIRFVSLKKIATLLKCTVRTIKNIIATFEELELINIAKISSDYVNILLPDYHKYHLSKEEGGMGGYLKMPKEFLLDVVVTAENVNALRVELRNYKKQMEDVYLNQQTESFYSVTEMKKFLPKHLHYKNAITKVIDGTKEAFDSTFNGHFVTFKIKEQYDGKLMEGMKKEQFHKAIYTFLEKHDVELQEKDMNDILQLSLEYGVQAVLESFEKYTTNKAINLADIKNIGGKIRTSVRNTLHQKMSA